MKLSKAELDAVINHLRTGDALPQRHPDEEMVSSLYRLRDQWIGVAQPLDEVVLRVEDQLVLAAHLTLTLQTLNPTGKLHQALPVGNFSQRPLALSKFEPLWRGLNKPDRPQILGPLYSKLQHLKMVQQSAQGQESAQGRNAQLLQFLVEQILAARYV